MDLLSQLVAYKQSSNETDQEEINFSTTTTTTTASTTTTTTTAIATNIISLNRNEGLKMMESDVNKNTMKSNVICKMEEANLESNDSPKFGIVESFMLKMAPDSGVQIFRSKKGFEKLAYDGFLYNLDKRHQKYVLWRCEMSKKPGYKCSGRVRMTEDSLDVKFNVLLNILAGFETIYVVE